MTIAANALMLLGSVGYLALAVSGVAVLRSCPTATCRVVVVGTVIALFWVAISLIVGALS